MIESFSSIKPLPATMIRSHNEGFRLNFFYFLCLDVHGGELFSEAQDGAQLAKGSMKQKERERKRRERGKINK